MKKLLTIAIPTYNRPKTLKQALDMISEQYDESIEVLICDDSTDDNVHNVVIDSQKKIPIRYIKNNTNLGFDRNFLQCFKEAKGKYVLLMGDDDILIDLPHIVTYLMKNIKVDWVIVNSSPISDRKSVRLKVMDDKVGVSKKEFMNYAGFGITSNTTILCKEGIENFNYFNKYIGNFFMQTCIPLDITKSDESILGIIGKPCIATRGVSDSTNLYKDAKSYFKAYGLGLRKVFCNIAPECGYDKHQMRKLFKSSVVVLPHPVAYMNANNLKNWRRAFWDYCYPAIKDFSIAWLTVIPIAIAPKWFAKFLLNYVYPLCHKFVLWRKNHHNNI